MNVPTGPTGGAGPTEPTESTGSTEPTGTGIRMVGSYNSSETFIAEHPTGEIGDTYLVEGYFNSWNAEAKIWNNPGSLIGPAGVDGATGPIGIPDVYNFSITPANISL